jgi:hypothetical protein
MIRTEDMNLLMAAAYLQSARAHLDNLAARLRSVPQAREVMVSFAPREYRSGLTLEAYVEAEMANGSALLWWLEMRAEEDFAIEAAIALTDEQGQRTLENLADVRASSLPEALRAFADAAERLASRADPAAILFGKADAAA